MACDCFFNKLSGFQKGAAIVGLAAVLGSGLWLGAAKAGWVACPFSHCQAPAAAKTGQ